jgi:hypothetical protein
MAKAKFFPIAELVSRLEKVAEMNRFDQVSRNVHAVYEQRMSKDPAQFVAAGDLRSTFNTFAGMDSNSDFRDHFEDVFDGPEAIVPKKDGEGSFDRVNYTDDNRVLASTISRDYTAEVKAKSLDAIRKTIESSLATPEFSYGGFVRVAGMGDSGFANWTVYFATARGKAAVSIPVTVVDGFPHTPEKFFGMSGAEKIFPFTHEALASYAKEFSGQIRTAAETKSGLTSLGDQSILPEAYFADAQYEMEDTRESNAISLNYTIPVNEDSDNVVEAVNSKVQDAINRAHQEVKDRISEGPDNVLQVSVSINYVGALDFEESEPSENPEVKDSNNMEEVGNAISTMMMTPVAKSKFKGVIAFNVSKSGSDKIATVPVDVDGDKVSISSFTGGGKTIKFSSDSIVKFLNESISSDVNQTVSVDDQDSLTDAFTDSFLGSNATLNELRKMIKSSIYSNNIPVANACLNVIVSKFEGDAPKKATLDYINWIKDAKEYELKQRTGGLTREDEAKRNKMDLDKVNDPMYSNDVQIHLM